MENEKGKRKTCWTFEYEDLILILKESDNMQSTVTASLMQLGLMLWRRRGKTKKRWQRMESPSTYPKAKIVF